MGDYDFEPRQAPSVFLSLKEKGDTVTVRLASSPYREPKVWKEGVRTPMKPDDVTKLTQKYWVAMMRDPEFNIAEVFHWVVIDRDSGQAKIFSSTAGVYKSIKKYAEMDAWGDPRTYDLQVERTENPGPGYYQVTALPNKDLLDDKQQADAAALLVQISEKLPAARKISEVQVDYIDEMDQSLDSVTPPEDDKPAPSEPKDDIVIEDVTDGSTPINLDDIPF